MYTQKKRSWLGFLALCFVFLTAATPSTQPNLSKQHPFGCLKLSPHKTYYVYHNIHQTLKQTAYGSKSTRVSHFQKWVYAIRLLKQTKHRIFLQITYKHLLLHVQIGTFSAWYDSRSPKKQLPFAAYTPTLVGKTLTLTLSPTGHVQAIQGLRTLHDAIRQTVRKHPAFQQISSAQQKKMEQQALTRFGDKQLRRQWSLFWSYVPYCSTSSSFQTSRMMSFPIYGMKQTQHWQRKRMPNALQLQSTLHTPSNNLTPFGVSAPISKQLRYKLKGKREGHLFLSHATGLPIGGTVHTTITGQIEWTPLAQMSLPSKKPPKKRTWPLYLQVTSTFQQNQKGTKR